MTPITEKTNRLIYGLLLLFFFLNATVSIQGQTKPEVAPPARSDTYSVGASGEKYRIQRREVAGTNFRIIGVDLAIDEEVLLQAARLFGKTPVLESGDASTSQEKACYRSAMENDRTHLVFGRGEVDFWFILSSDGSLWNGNHVCTQSAKITRNVATDSGLHLGLTEEQVIAILGLATRRSQNAQWHRDMLIYSLEAREKTDPQKLAWEWQQEIEKNPGASRDGFLENYAFYDLEVEIWATFVSDSLTRLMVSWSAQY